MSESPSKRQIPPFLRDLLQKDAILTKNVFEAFDKKYSLAQNRHHLKNLEYSCHGIPWLGFTIAMLYFSPKNAYLWMNLLWLLILDIVVVAVIKALTRRRRPAYNQPDMTSISVDKFSFPSGHATRAVTLFLFVSFLYPIPVLLRLPVLVWSAAVCVSRVLLGRHHLLDVAGGVIIGVVETVMLAMTWMSEERAEDIGAYLFGDDPWSNA